MSVIDELLEHNRAFAGGHAPEAASGRPRRAIAVVACMDARLDLFGALGLEVGDAHVLRNAGGVVSDDVIRSLAISQRKLGTREVLLMQHTRCGLIDFDDDGFRAEVAADTGSSPTWSAHSLSGRDDDVRAAVGTLRVDAALPLRDEIRVFDYDATT